MAAQELNFTLDLVKAVSIAKRDPDLWNALAAELVSEEQAPISDALGSCNQGSVEAPDWSSIFLRTRRAEDGGFAGIVKVKSNGRLMLRIVPQNKNQQTDVPEHQKDQLRQMLDNPEVLRHVVAALGTIGTK